jgi:predicted FMN-binding regulatory protein PaiB
MEYLCSGRPILVHSPADSYLSDLCRRKGFGMLVDQPDVKLLASQINLLLSDETKQKSIVNKALTFAKERDSRVWHERLKELLSKQEA